MPYLARYNKDGCNFVAIIIRENGGILSGVVVDTNDPTQGSQIGYYCDSWIKHQFIPLDENETVTLHNVKE